MKNDRIENLKNENNQKQLLKILKEGMYNERISVLKALGEIQNVEHIREILPFLDDNIEAVRNQAFETLKFFNLDNKTEEIINEKVAHWNEVTNKKKNWKLKKEFDNLHKLTNEDIVTLFNGTTLSKEEKEIVEKEILNRGGLNEVKRLSIEDFRNKLVRYTNKQLLIEFKNKHDAGFVSYDELILEEIENRGGVDVINESIRVEDENLEKESRKLFLKKRKQNILIIVVVVFIAFLVYSSFKIKEANQKRDEMRELLEKIENRN